MICHYLNISPRTIQNWKRKGLNDMRKGAAKKVHNKLTSEEEDKIKGILSLDRFVDLPPHAIIPVLAQEGEYIASESTFYRIMRKSGMLNDRRDQKASRKSEQIEIKATGPDQLWSWDITYLKTYIKGKYYYLYLFLDIWGRYIVGWEVYEAESGLYAKELFNRISKEKKVKGITLHSDNGGPMISSTLRARLEDLRVIQSFSRPHVSNDNAYSESAFKTLKYSTGYPRKFKTIEQAKDWVGKFVNWYNYEHLHSGIGYVTPYQRMTGEDCEIFETRNETYRLAKEKNPARWSGDVKQWEYRKEVILKKGNYTRKAS